MSRPGKRNQSRWLLSATQAVRSLRRAPVRSAMTAAGMVIGVTSVVVMLSIGEGARARMEETLMAFGDNVVMLTASKDNDNLRTGETPFPETYDGLKISDYQEIRSMVGPDVVLSPNLVGSSSLARVNGKGAKVQIFGVDVDAPAVQQRHIVSGAFFGASDVATAGSVCVIASSVEARLFGSQSAIGKFIKLNGISFVVIGVVANQELLDASGVHSEDVSVFMPYTSLMRRLNRSPVFLILLRTRSRMEIPSLKTSIVNVVEGRRGKRNAVFDARSVEENVHLLTEGARTMTLLLASLAAVSLVVGGMGIMNIMGVTVRERTREIGLRLALGTRPHDIQSQFLLEAILLALVGGVIGVALGICCGMLATYLNSWPMRVSAGAIAGALLFSMLIGALAGLQPARRASGFTPVYALKLEAE